MAAPGFGLILEGDKLVVSVAPRGSFFDPRFLVAALLDHVARGDGAVFQFARSCRRWRFVIRDPYRSGARGGLGHVVAGDSSRWSAGW